MKKCSTCKKMKPISDFYKDVRTKDGRKYQCKKCHVECCIKTRDIERARNYQRNWMRNSRYHTRPEVRERDRIRSRTKNKGIYTLDSSEI